MGVTKQKSASENGCIVDKLMRMGRFMRVAICEQVWHTSISTATQLKATLGPAQMEKTLRVRVLNTKVQGFQKFLGITITNIAMPS